MKVGYEVQKAQRKSAKYTQRRVNRKIEKKKTSLQLHKCAKSTAKANCY